jgi:hypothetical protein
MRTGKKKDLDEVKSQLGVKADVPKTDIKGTANFNAKFKQMTEQKKFEYDIDVYMDGYTGEGYQNSDTEKGWTPEEVFKALNWFRKMEQGQPYMAKLVHYSQIAPGYRRTIKNIDPEVFSELNKLYGHLWEVRALDKALPPEITDKSRAAINKFMRDVETNQGALATNGTLRNELTGKGNELVSNLGKAAARKAFFDEVMSCRPNEPAAGSGIGGRSDLEPWEYGYTPDQPYWAQVVRSANGAVDIKSEKRELNVAYEFFKHGLGKRQEATLSINDNDKLIVGWTVKSNWGADHNGSWWKETNGPILLGTRGAVHARGEETRGAHWTVIYYYVNNADYPFQVSAQPAQPKRG